MGAVHALDVEHLRVELRDGSAIIDDVSLQVSPGEIVGLVGESGSGKTTTALAVLGYARPGVRITGGTIQVGGEAIDLRNGHAARRLRGRLVSYVPQDPANALNPALRIRQSIQDVLDEAAGARPDGASVEDSLARVHLPPAPEFAKRFPHQLSGGQLQRVMIACALVCRPPLVVLDEPTTGLDVVTQARVLEEIERLRRERGLAMLYVSHDLAVVAQVADRIAVMYAGRVVEEGPTREVLARPQHPYTAGLVASIPDLANPRRLQSMPGVSVSVGERPAGCAFAPRCAQVSPACEAEMPALESTGGGRRTRCLHWASTPSLVGQPLIAAGQGGDSGGEALLQVEHLAAEYRNRGDTTVAASDVSFAIHRGACVALVGESGSGKTTLARCVAGLHAPSGGRILLDGVPLAGKAARRPLDARRRIQIVFQNAYDSLNPRHAIADSVARPARILRNLSAAAAREEVDRLLEQVRLPRRVARCYPAELSGGERQRAAIARALAAAPDLIVCDEITSALDVSVQAAVLQLLAELRAELGLALLFITHDLGVVATVADAVLVLDHGVVCEQGGVDAVIRRPQSDYTRLLLDAAPRLPVVPA